MSFVLARGKDVCIQQLKQYPINLNAPNSIKQQRKNTVCYFEAFDLRFLDQYNNRHSAAPQFLTSKL